MRNIWPHPAKERIETAMRVELSVHALYCLADKNNPTHIRVFEMHANIDAYKAHLESALQKIQRPDSGDGQVPQSRAGESDYSWRQVIVRETAHEALSHLPHDRERGRPHVAAPMAPS